MKARAVATCGHVIGDNGGVEGEGGGEGGWPGSAAYRVYRLRVSRPPARRASSRRAVVVAPRR